MTVKYNVTLYFPSINKHGATTRKTVIKRDYELLITRFQVLGNLRIEKC
jgi:hypothetical protein